MKAFCLAFLVFVLVPVATAGPAADQKVTFGGQYFYLAHNPSLIVIGGNVVKRSDGSVTGKLLGHWPTLDFDVRVDMTCLEIHGDVAIMAGLITSGHVGAFDLTGWVMVIGMRDKGEGASAEDTVSEAYFFPGSDPCARLAARRAVILSQLNGTHPTLAPNPLVKGNIQVHG